MDVNRILIELRTDRYHIEQAIAALERVGGKKRRGRPPKWMSSGVSDKRAPVERRVRATDDSRTRAKAFEPSKSPV